LNFTPENEFKNCPTLENITLENLIVWKAIIQYYENHILKNGKNNDDDSDDDNTSHDKNSQDILADGELLPELSVMCNFIEKYVNEAEYNDDKWKKLNFNHCLLTMLEIVKFYDFVDEIGREKLKKILKKILVEHQVSEHVVRQIIELYELLFLNVEERLSFLNQVVRDVINSNSPSGLSLISQVDSILKDSNDIELKLKVTEVKLKIMKLVETENSYVERKLYADAQKAAEQVASANEELANLLRNFTNSSTENGLMSSSAELPSILEHFKSKKLTHNDIVKSLQIAFYMIISKGVKSLTMDVLDLYKEFITRHRDSIDMSVRIWALKSSTAFSMLHDTIAVDVFVTLKAQLFRTTDNAIWIVSIECIFELIDRYGFQFLGDSRDNNKSISENENEKSKKSSRTLYNSELPEDDEEEPNIVNSKYIHFLF
jgi:condensin complex subunit 3